MKYQNILSLENDKKRLTNKYICSDNDEKTKFNFYKGKEYMNQIKQKKIKITSIKRKYIFIFILLFSIFPILSKELLLFYNRFSYITLTIEGIGEKRVFYERDDIDRCHYFVPPDEVYINDINQNEISFKYHFNESRNIVKLIWKKEVNAIPCMFYRCSDIKEIDFSHFNPSLISGDILGMFNNCTSLISLDLSYLSISITNMEYLFYNCYSLTSINLTNLDTSKVVAVQFMFANCYSLKSINLSSFKTPELVFINQLFDNCILLTSVDISNFELTKITDMSAMFNNCTSLKTVKFPNSKTPNLLKTGSIFRNCISLVSVDLSNLITSKSQFMDYMFYNCKSLTSINLSNFDTSSVTWIQSMFEGCSNLQYINLQNAKQTNNINYIYDNVFKDTPENLVICINEANAKKLAELIKQKNSGCYKIDCSNDWKSIQKKLKLEQMVVLIIVVIMENINMN